MRNTAKYVSLIILQMLAIAFFFFPSISLVRIYLSSYFISESSFRQVGLIPQWGGYVLVLYVILIPELVMFICNLRPSCSYKPIPDITLISVSIIQFLLYAFPPIFLTSTPIPDTSIPIDFAANIVSYSTIYFLGYIPLILITSILLINTFKRKTREVVALVLATTYFALSIAGLIIKKNSEKEMALINCRVNIHNLLCSTGSVDKMYNFYDKLSFHLEKTKSNNHNFSSEEKEELNAYSNFLKDYPIDRIDYILSPCYDLDNKITEYKASAETLIQLLNNIYLDEIKIDVTIFTNAVEMYKIKKSALENKIIEITNIANLNIILYAEDIYDISEQLLLQAKEINSTYITNVDTVKLEFSIVNPKDILSKLEAPDETTSTAHVSENIFNNKCISIDRNCVGCGYDFKYVFLNKEIEPIYNKYSLENYEFCDITIFIYW